VKHSPHVKPSAEAVPTETMMNRPDDTCDQRQTRLLEIRQEIAADTYETPARLSAAVEALLDDLEGRGEFSGRPCRRPK